LSRRRAGYAVRYSITADVITRGDSRSLTTDPTNWVAYRATSIGEYASMLKKRPLEVKKNLGDYTLNI